jgi:hypothetical protein
VLADRLRAEWLLVLAGKGDLAEFDTERRRLVVGADDAQLACYTLLTRYALDDGHRRDAIVREARRFLALSDRSGQATAARPWPTACSTTLSCRFGRACRPLSSAAS